MNYQANNEDLRLYFKEMDEVKALWVAVSYYYNQYGSKFNKETKDFYKHFLTVLSLFGDAKDESN